MCCTAAHAFGGCRQAGAAPQGQCCRHSFGAAGGKIFEVGPEGVDLGVREGAGRHRHEQARALGIPFYNSSTTSAAIQKNRRQKASTKPPLMPTEPPPGPWGLVRG